MASVLFDCERMKYPYTGLYNFCLNLGAQLIAQKRSDDEVHFFVPENRRGIFGDGMSYVPKRLMHAIPVPGSKGFRISPDSSGYDVWHMSYQTTRYRANRARTRTVFTVHDLNFLHEDPDNNRRKKKYFEIIQKRLDIADHIVCISKYCHDDVINHLNTRGKPVSVIYNGSNFLPNATYAPPGYRPSRPFLFALGMVLRKKNFQVLPCLLKVFDGELVISGEDHSDYKNIVIAEAKKHGVLDRVIFTGPVTENDKAWYYQHCTAFVFPSIAEGFGMPVVEAMCCGKPAFLSTYTSLPEIGGPHAYYFESFEPEAMCNVLLNGLQHFVENNPGDAIRAWVTQFSWEKAGHDYWQIYRTLANA